jgi:hypothetical protein
MFNKLVNATLLMTVGAVLNDKDNSTDPTYINSESLLDGDAS